MSTASDDVPDVRRDVKSELAAIDTALRLEVSDSLGSAAPVGDRRDGRVYLADHDLRLAIRVALAAGRPLLLRGLPGTGKSSVAAFVAERLRWRYYEIVMTSETLATDLLWRYDVVRRLADAQMPRRRFSAQPGQPRQSVELPAWNYLEPGPLWWAQSRGTAADRGAPDDVAPAKKAVDPSGTVDSDNAVLLIDEIDKAEPNVPNALLVPLGSQSFAVEPTGRSIQPDSDPDRRMLIVITTNEERDLPRAFVRRCVVHTMPVPDESRMVEIAKSHDQAAGRAMDKAMQNLCLEVAKCVKAIQDDLRKAGQRPPGTAEFLDAWRTARDLSLTPEHEEWKFVEQLTLRKEFTDLLEEGL